MPVKRDDDGKIVEEPTKMEVPSCDQKTKVIGRPGRQKSTAEDNAYNRLTRKSGELRIRQEVPTPNDSIGETVIIRRSGNDLIKKEEESMQDPTVGWLVIIKGPGRGNVLKIGVGQNSFGRDTSERISLDFGDKGISRLKHGRITYDPVKRIFLIQQGDGENLVYIKDNQNVLEATELEADTHIRVSNTVMRFVPLCGSHFDWSDTDS